MNRDTNTITYASKHAMLLAAQKTVYALSANPNAANSEKMREAKNIIRELSGKATNPGKVYIR